ncbi:galectin-5-like [Garra rufa]|uniref:galectin-5-like n=1 Tax=Garra rufa TaxID=137080 RepID=UPI003CCE60F6
MPGVACKPTGPRDGELPAAPVVTGSVDVKLFTELKNSDRYDHAAISTNGKPYSEYKHLVPFKSVDRFQVDGKVELNLVAFQLAPHLVAPPGSLKVPYKSIIHGGLYVGKVIIIQGLIKSQPYRIVISLRHKLGIAFDYSPRFDENAVVRNTYENGIWGRADRSEPMPFQKGDPTLVAIFCGQHQYEVFVNGEKAHTYKHRFTKLEEIDVLDIRGGIELTFVQA